MRILGIETSCDETAAAVVEDGHKVLSSVIASSADMHIASGGIIPENAARRQVESIIPVIQKALLDASIKSKIYDLGSTIDTIAVTYGPGLIGSLLVGVETAKTLSHLWQIPLIPVNHLVAHIYANFVGKETRGKSQDTNSHLPSFPALALVVSGGHTDLVLMKGHPSANSGQASNIKWLGGTRDDAAGECFDKCARLLDLPYPGGPSISAEANKYFQHPGSLPAQTGNNYDLTTFPRPMLNSKDFDFSFSGLKTSVFNRVKEQKSGRMKVIPRDQLAAEVQEAIVDVLVKKSLDAIKKYKPKSFLLSGGVAANSRLRERLRLETGNLKLETTLHIPDAKYCTDNGVVIAASAFYGRSTTPWQKISANPELSITDRI